MSWEIREGDCRTVLAELKPESVQCVVTSPPYWGLRDYSVEGQLGLEATPEEYVTTMVEVFREVRRVLRKDGTLWLNMGDSYAGSPGGSGGWDGNNKNPDGTLRTSRHASERWQNPAPSLKPKDLVGIPWRLAFALQADGWYLRSDIIWAKPNPMPESVTDRPTKSHEYVFLLTRSARYFYDADAVREPHTQLAFVAQIERQRAREAANGEARRDAHFDAPEDGVARLGATTADRYLNPAGRNLRSVWNIPTEPFPEAHFATFPKALVEPCIKAGTSEKGCCPECGAAWIRQVEVREDYRQWAKTQRFYGEGGKGSAFREAKTNSHSAPIKSEFKDWQPTCLHSLGDGAGTDDQAPGPVVGRPLDPIPCTVLDPFAGSGTVGLVALRLGRSFIGIELSPTYAEMARERIRWDAPLFNMEEA